MQLKVWILIENYKIIFKQCLHSQNVFAHNMDTSTTAETFLSVSEYATHVTSDANASDVTTLLYIAEPVKTGTAMATGWIIGLLILLALLIILIVLIICFIRLNRGGKYPGTWWLVPRYVALSTQVQSASIQVRKGMFMV